MYAVHEKKKEVCLFWLLMCQTKGESVLFLSHFCLLSLVNVLSWCTGFTWSIQIFLSERDSDWKAWFFFFFFTFSPPFLSLLFLLFRTIQKKKKNKQTCGQSYRASTIPRIWAWSAYGLQKRLKNIQNDSMRVHSILITYISIYIFNFFHIFIHRFS